MKNLTATKKSVISICISLFVVLLMVLATRGVSKSTNLVQQSNGDMLAASDKMESYGSNTLTVSSAIDKDAYIITNEGSALILASMIFMCKANIKEVTHYETGDVIIDKPAANLAQGYYNFKFQREYGIKVDNTCSLLAMIIASDALGINDEIDLPGAIQQTELYRNLEIFNELYNISLKYGNEYEGNNAGTMGDTISKIIKEFYSNHGYNYAISEKDILIDLRKYVYENFSGPCLLSINNGRDYDGEDFGPHTVALLGIYNIKLEYKTNLGIRKKGDFHAFIICDGWQGGNDGDIGKNYQILIFNTFVKDAVELVKLIERT